MRIIKFIRTTLILMALGWLGILAGCSGWEKIGSVGGDVFDRGGIRINTEPRGADVYINEGKVGRAPHLEPCKPGIYRIVAKKRGYSPLEQWVTVPKGQTVEITLKLNRPE